MRSFPQEEILWPTPKGDVRIRSFCSAEEIRTYNFDSQFGTHAHYRSLYTRRESLEQDALQQDTNVVLGLSDETNIVGIGVLAYPDPDERWIKVGPKIMMEVKALEVVRSWRSTRLSKGVIRMLLSHPLIEDKIFYFVGYSWTWDLDGSQKSAQEYRAMLIKLMEPYGFVEYQTNEPNICLKPENIFMGRVGKNITPEIRNAFKWTRFGVYEL